MRNFTLKILGEMNYFAITKFYYHKSYHTLQYGIVNVITAQ